MSGLIDANAAWNGEYLLSLGDRTLKPFSLSTVSDAEKQLDVWDNLITPLKADSLIPKVLSSMKLGVDAKLTRASRMRNDVPVATTVLSVDMTKVDKKQFPRVAQLQQVSQWKMDTAVSKRVCVSSVSPATVNILLDRIKDGGAQQTQKYESDALFGMNQSLYIDIDLSQMVPVVQGAEAGGAPAKKAQYWVAGARFESGRAQVRSILPLAPTIEIFKSVGPMLPDFLQALSRLQSRKTRYWGNTMKSLRIAWPKPGVLAFRYALLGVIAVACAGLSAAEFTWKGGTGANFRPPPTGLTMPSPARATA